MYIYIYIYICIYSLFGIFYPEVTWVNMGYVSAMIVISRHHREWEYPQLSSGGQT